ncbi:MAG: NAD(P)H-dependent oxidoreductase [Pseudomonadota bacterium]
MTNLLGISGSLRAGSFNTKLVKECARVYAPESFTLADIRLPLFDEDLEAQGKPAEVEALVAQIRAADAVVISTPEYNKNLPGGLKNALDWISRFRPGPLVGKPLAIVSAAAGRAGGERAQFSLRHCLTPFNPRILQNPEVMIAGAGGAFNEDGQLADPKAVEFLGVLMEALKKEVALVKAAD